MTTTQATSSNSGESVFRAAIPYAVGTFALGISGIVISATAATYGALATVFCGCDSLDAQDFKAKWWKYTVTIIFTGFVNMMAETASRMFYKIVFGESRSVHV
jgi:hypothetical protein